jgi:hypothetical protein
MRGYHDLRPELPAQTRDERRQKSRTRIFAVFVIFSAMLTQPSYAQPFPESERQKAQEEREKADKKANDEAYKATMKRLPNSDKKVDPWGAVRAPSAGK